MTGCAVCGGQPVAAYMVRVGEVPADPGNPRTPDRSGVYVVRTCASHVPTLPLSDRVTVAATTNGHGTRVAS